MMDYSEERFARAIELYMQWNEKINVISRKDIDNVYSHHILHSLCIVEYLRLEQPDIFGKWCSGGVSVLDLGTGGGFPGIPLAMVFPEVKFTLCDSIGKKVRVASEVASALGLANVECVNARAESLPQTFDWVVSRAVTSLENFYPWVNGKYREGILYLKGGDVESEMEPVRRKYKVQCRAWNVKPFLDDDYFAEKFVIHIGKNYLCTPK